MAIRYLSNIDLVTNELQYPVLHPLTSAPTAYTPREGQLYYNSVDNKVKVYNGSAWVTVGGVNSITSGDNNHIDISGTASDPIIYANVAPVSTGSPNLVTGGEVESYIAGLDLVYSVATEITNFISTTNTGTDTNPIISVELSATGGPDNTKYLRGDNTWSTISPVSITLTGDVTGSGTTSIATTIATGAVEFAMMDPTVIITSSEGIGNNNNDVTLPTSAAVKSYVDASTTGALIFQGGYNASTNAPNLDSPPTGVIKKGFMWTVTVDGVFFTEQVRVGDSLIANTDTPTTLADWTTVQGNTDLATLTTVGLGNVNAAGGGISGIGVTYSNGTALVENIDKGSTQSIFKNIAVSGQATVVAETNDDTLTLVAGNSIAITTNTNTDTITIASTYTPPVTSGAIAVNTSNTYTYPNSITASAINNVMIQLVDTVTHETVYADVTRISTTSFAVSYAATPTNGVTALIQLIG